MKPTCYIIALVILLFSLSSAQAAETLLTQKQIKRLFSDRTMTVTAVNYKKRQITESKKKSFRLFTTELGAAHTADEDSDLNVRGWLADEDNRFCFSKPLTKSKRNQRNTCGQIVWDGNITYHMYQTTKLVQRGNKVAGKKKKELLLVFTNLGKGNRLED